MPRRKVENRTIKVILLESNKHLGEKFELVNVKPIYARNVLLPKNMAVLATPDMVNKYAQKMEAATKERERKAEGFQGLLANIQKDGGLSFIGKVNKEGTLYAKIDETDIAKLVKETYKLDVEDHFFKLKKKITSVGDYNVPFLYKELKGDITVKVIAENPDVIEKKSKPSEEVIVKSEEGEEENVEEVKEETIEEKSE
ncbi:MAG TPA: 50S ribosomal protein L9 [Candidatus Absconditabacterales bacterium]|nr:50S ribosomal protein L9 [Candidatus Absconditabacterales bacterium]